MVITLSTNTHSVRNILGAIFFLFAVAWLYFFSGLGENTTAQCQADAEGSGFCNFTNSGWTPGSMCVSVSLTGNEGVVVSSGMICSGRIWPDDTNRRDISIVVPNGHCIGLAGSKLENICQMTISTSDKIVEHARQIPTKTHDETVTSASDTSVESPGDTVASTSQFSAETPTASIQTIDGSNGIKYEIQDVTNGKLLESVNSTITLETSCLASSPQHGNGKWSWANDSVQVEFDNETIGFPHQDPPFDDPRCPMD